MAKGSGGHSKIGRAVAVAVSILSGLLAIAALVASVWVAYLLTVRPIAEPVGPAIAYSILLPVALIFGIVAVRGLDSGADRLLGTSGWRSVMLAVLGIGLVLTVAFHPIALLMPVTLTIVMYLMVDPSADWLRSLFSGSVN